MEPNDEDRRILALARDARTPGADDKARVEARLALLLGVAGAAATTSVAAPAAATGASGLAGKAAGTTAALKWTLGSCALLAAALATYAALPRPAIAPKPAHVSAPAALHDTAPPSPAQPPAPAAGLADQGPDQAPDPEPAHAVRHTHARAGRGTGGESGALGAELELLHAAQSAWRAGDATRALALVAEHRAHHPRSALGLERDALRVLALCDLGRTQEAVRLGRAWLSRAPSSPLRASVERSCAMQ